MIFWKCKFCFAIFATLQKYHSTCWMHGLEVLCRIHALHMMNLPDFSSSATCRSVFLLILLNNWLTSAILCAHSQLANASMLKQNGEHGTHYTCLTSVCLHRRWGRVSMLTLAFITADHRDNFCTSLFLYFTFK